MNERTILEWTEPDWCEYRSGLFHAEIYPLDHDSRPGFTLCLRIEREGDDFKALAQRLQDVLDGVPMLDIATLNLIVDDFVEIAMWDVRDTYNSVGERLRDVIVERLTK